MQNASRAAARALVACARPTPCCARTLTSHASTSLKQTLQSNNAKSALNNGILAGKVVCVPVLAGGLAVSVRHYCSQKGKPPSPVPGSQPNVEDEFGFDMHMGLSQESPQQVDGKTWLCAMCDTKNPTKSPRCSSCDGPRPAAGTWVCNTCEQVNPKDKSDCIGCGAKVPEHAFKGYYSENYNWDCPSCGHFNFKWRGVCQKCRTRSPNAKPRDWICGGCDTLNFARAKKCVRCGILPTLEGIVAPAEKTPQEVENSSERWICGKCGHSNNISRSACGGCRTPKKKMVGDWSCRKCGKVNFRFRTECFSCNTKKDESGGPWNCPKCKHYNFSKRDHCIKCNTGRPFGAS